ncbi:nucleotide-binding domain-containing protein [Xylaria arbuscula]|nr:nucleotide-binding domain-containing protein [Xylaria arbuscula]
MASDPHSQIVIIGAGIIGLDVALVLSERGFGRNITVVAQYLPGDTAPEYTSPWQVNSGPQRAGCNFSAISGTDPNALKWDRAGYMYLGKLAAQSPDQAYVLRTPSIEYWDEDIPHDKIQTMSEYLEDNHLILDRKPPFRVLPADKLPAGTKFGIAFTTLTVNAPKHLDYLYSRLKQQYGVTFVRQSVDSVTAAFADNPTNTTIKLVFNCTGNAARTLPGVRDVKCYPTRGQVLLAHAENVRTNVMRHGKDYETYVIPRPLSNGHVVLGGYMQKGNGDYATYGHETRDILARTTALTPELCGGEYQVIAAVSGLRPSREMVMLAGGEKRPVVHNYGAGGTGFQAGYGMALDAVELAEDVLTDIKRERETRARL